MPHARNYVARYARLVGAATLGAALVFCSPSAPQAQRLSKEREVNVTGVASRSTEKESVVTITGDGNLARAQTWQDRDGTFHVVLPKGHTDLRNSGAARGVKVQRVGDSLEIVVQSKPGASVTVQPRFNRLDLVVSGSLQEGRSEQSATSAPQWSASPSASSAEEAGVEVERPSRSSMRRRSANVGAYLPQTYLPMREEAKTVGASGEAQNPTAGAMQHNGQAAAATENAAQSAASPQTGGATDASAEMSGAANATQDAVAAEQATTPKANIEDATQQSSLLFSPTGLVGLLGLVGLSSLLVIRRRRRDAGWVDVDEQGNFKLREEKLKEEKAQQEEPKKEEQRKEAKADANAEQKPFDQHKGDRRKGSDRRALQRGFGDRRKSGPGAEPVATLEAQHNAQTLEKEERGERKVEARSAYGSAMPAVLYGAFRIDQEVGKLVEGQVHSIEVLASRAPDDRRAVETSLLKVLRANESNEEMRRRARLSLEEYGFVARMSATLLLSQEAYDRATAARLLGEIGSSASLPFLLEALYDPEQVVRNEVVASLGALRQPRAIGPMIDVARRYPEMPTALLAPALSACSVEAVDVEWSSPEECHTSAPAFMAGQPFTGEIVGLEPAVKIEQLPEWLEDESLADALDRLGSVDIEARVAAAQSLAQYQVQRAVEALSAMAARDPESTVRATAVTSLGTIGHESVFAPVLMALADDAREVRAAAARALSRLSFDRADAYVRVIETANPATLRGVAQACVKAGLTAQAVERLTSEDRRQAYEAFSLLSLVVKAGETAQLLEAVEHHPNLNVRLAAIKLLGMMGRPTQLVEPLRQMAKRGGVPEVVRAQIMDVVSSPQHDEMHAV